MKKWVKNKAPFIRLHDSLYISQKAVVSYIDCREPRLFLIHAFLNSHIRFIDRHPDTALPSHASQRPLLLRCSAPYPLHRRECPA